MVRQAQKGARNGSNKTSYGYLIKLVLLIKLGFLRHKQFSADGSVLFVKINNFLLIRAFV